MLADTDAGSIITAAQSGAQWGYSLLLLQVVLMPILFIVQELTVRLGGVTGKGHAELIKSISARGWAWVSVAALIVACLGALLTEVRGPHRRRQPDRRPAGGDTGAGRRGDAGDGADAGYADGRADRDRGRRVRARVPARRLVAHPGLAEMASGALTIPATDPQYL